MNLSQGGEVTILLADEARTMREMEKSFFRRESYRVLVGASARDVYETVFACLPDIVFMGLDFAGMAGDELCRRFKDHPQVCHIPVVLVASPHRPGDVPRCETSGCDQILMKPPRRHQFLQAVEKHLSVPRRAAPRIAVRTPVAYRSGSGGLQGAFFSVNLSSGGLYVEQLSPLAADTPLTLRFTVPGCPEPIRCEARVAWVHRGGMSGNRRLPAGMGLQFVNLPPANAAAIRSFVLRSLTVPQW